MTTRPTPALFLGPQPASHDAYGTAMACAQAQVLSHFAPLTQAYSGASPHTLQQRFADVDPCPEQGQPLEQVLHWVGQQVLADCVAVGHPMTMAHLHCAPLLPALAAEVLISASNASMDSWDQAPAPSHLEQHIVGWLCGQFGLGPQADGIFTSGGTQSNFLGLLLARDRFCQRELGVQVQRTGLPAQASRLRVLCSAVAHFSVQQSCAILGLGHDAVVPVPVDSAMRMDTQQLHHTVTELRAQGLLPFAVVATAGSTDFGSIDPLGAVADVARQTQLWLHVDAAYGGALVFSERLQPLLAGIHRADSLTVDFHKLFWQPISASALLLRDRAGWELLRLHADYLNPAEAEAQGTLDLVTKSIQTTRRFDSLKLLVTLRTLGRQGFAALVEQTVDLAQAVAGSIDADRFFERVAPVAINAVVFRCAGPDWSDAQADLINAQLREQLLLQGRAVIGRTRVNGRCCLKFTLLNPGTELAAVQQLLHEIKTRALQLAEGAAV
jgi:L-2,4-diaminobutyrate decarboxylase